MGVPSGVTRTMAARRGGGSGFTRLAIRSVSSDPHHRAQEDLPHELPGTPVPRRGRRGERDLPPDGAPAALTYASAALPTTWRPARRRAACSGCIAGTWDRTQSGPGPTSIGRSPSRSTSWPARPDLRRARLGEARPATSSTSRSAGSTAFATSPASRRRCSSTSPPARRARATSRAWPVSRPRAGRRTEELDRFYAEHDNSGSEPRRDGCRLTGRDGNAMPISRT